MSDLSIKYDPQAIAPNPYPAGADLQMTLQALANDMVPEDIRRNASTKHHRDAVIGVALQQMSDFGIKNVLKTLTNKLRSMADNTSEEVRVYCELVATLAYASGDMDLTKQALLRIDPSSASGLLKTIYSAAVERGIDPQTFKGMLELNADQAIAEWQRTQV